MCVQVAVCSSPCMLKSLCVQFAFFEAFRQHRLRRSWNLLFENSTSLVCSHSHRIDQTMHRVHYTCAHFYRRFSLLESVLKCAQNPLSSGQRLCQLEFALSLSLYFSLWLFRRRYNLQFEVGVFWLELLLVRISWSELLSVRTSWLKTL